MSGQYHPEILLDMGKAKIQRYHQETAAAKLAQEAQKGQPGHIITAVNQAVHFFTPLLRKLEKPAGSVEKPAQATLKKNPQT